jgi:hypothetical protein
MLLWLPPGGGYPAPRDGLPAYGGCMYHLELTGEELSVLRQTLESHIEDLMLELAHTDTHEFKKVVKHRLEMLEHIFSRLNPEMQKVAF